MLHTLFTTKKWHIIVIGGIALILLGTGIASAAVMQHQASVAAENNSSANGISGSISIGTPVSINGTVITGTGGLHISRNSTIPALPIFGFGRGRSTPLAIIAVAGSGTAPDQGIVVMTDGSGVIGTLPQGTIASSGNHTAASIQGMVAGATEPAGTFATKQLQMDILTLMRLSPIICGSTRQSGTGDTYIVTQSVIGMSSCLQAQSVGNPALVDLLNQVQALVSQAQKL